MTRRQSGVSLERLRGMTSAAVWERGEDYAEDGAVTLVSVAPDRVVARVEGSELYRCTLAGRELLEMDCTCPAFEDYSGPCKHLVATALTLARRKEEGAPLPAERLRSFLGGLPSERLVELLLEVAEADPELEARLLLQADTAGAPPSRLGKVLRRALAQALRTGDFVDYREMADWAGRVDAVIDRMEDSAGAGAAQAAVVLELVPELIAGLEGALEHTDDDGHIGMLLERSTTLLGSAALAARPDPAALARLLVRLDLSSEYAEIGPPSGALAEALGEQGRTAYWAAIEEAWAGLEELRPKEREPQPRPSSDEDDPRRWLLRERMLARARAQQDAEAEVAVLAKSHRGGATSAGRRRTSGRNPNCGLGAAGHARRRRVLAEERMPHPPPRLPRGRPNATSGRQPWRGAGDRQELPQAREFIHPSAPVVRPHRRAWAGAPHPRQRVWQYRRGGLG